LSFYPPLQSINFKEKKISEDSSKIETAQLVTTTHIKWKTIVPFYPPLQSTLRRRKYRKTVQKLRAQLVTTTHIKDELESHTCI